MKFNFENFGIKADRKIPVDELIEKALYDRKFGYYTNKLPFGKKGDFITSPTISNLFSEIIGVWVISCWEKLGKPEKFNFVELGPGDGSLTKVLVNTFQKFPKFYKTIRIFMYEKSDFLKKLQKKKIKNKKVKWIKNFKTIKKGPVIFFGNEFFDAIPIKQFLRKNGTIEEKCYSVNKNGLRETFKDATVNDKIEINSYKALGNIEFIEFPKLGFIELRKIVKKISTHSGGILLIDYGYINSINKNTLQTVMNNKKENMSKFLDNMGKADITYLVNFSLLKEYFINQKLSVKKIVSQKFFLERMGIIERAEILKKKLNSKQKHYMSITLMRLLSKKFMGELFKAIFAFKTKKNNFLGFD